MNTTALWMLALAPVVLLAATVTAAAAAVVVEQQGIRRGDPAGATEAYAAEVAAWRHGGGCGVGACTARHCAGCAEPARVMALPSLYVGRHHARPPAPGLAARLAAHARRAAAWTPPTLSARLTPGGAL